MSYDATNSSEPSMKKILLVFGVIVIGAFTILALFVFPISNLIRDEITTEVIILSKNEGICVIDTPDHPRGISNCPYNVGDTIIIKYKEGTNDILEHTIKK